MSRAYEIAHEIPEVLAQQPCYCYYEKFGHGSLLEVFLAAQVSESGETPERIREAIVAGMWELVDLEASR